MKIEFRRESPGEYRMSKGDQEVVISRFYWLTGPQWVVYSLCGIASDPMWTLKEAKRQAELILANC